VGSDVGGPVKLVSGAQPNSGQDSSGHSKVSSNGVNRTQSTSISDRSKIASLAHPLGNQAPSHNRPAYVGICVVAVLINSPSRKKSTLRFDATVCQSKRQV